MKPANPSMKVCVVGLWHLGSVTAACLASVGHKVIGLDADERIICELQRGVPPIAEPGLPELISEGLHNERLLFTSDALEALAGAQIVWVAHDTPVDEDDRADVSFVTDRIAAIFPYLSADTLVLISSQLPIGTTSGLAERYAATGLGRSVSFGYSPENLRLGKAIHIFTHPDRVVVGLETTTDRHKVERLLSPVTNRIEWMSVESAEMTKHAINAFLATSVTFTNELAVLCEAVGADAKEVERGLRTEDRIGARAYVSPGGAFAGGTLARDVQSLCALSKEYGRSSRVLSAIMASNNEHKRWPLQTVRSSIGPIADKKVAVLGLTYKPGTDTLRRSGAVELCRWLVQEGAAVRAHDPAVKRLPKELAEQFDLFPSPLEALKGASAAVIATEWPDYRSISAEDITSTMDSPVVVDPNRFLAATLAGRAAIRYAAVGGNS